MGSVYGTIQYKNGCINNTAQQQQREIISMDEKGNKKQNENREESGFDGSTTMRRNLNCKFYDSKHKIQHRFVSMIFSNGHGSKCTCTSADVVHVYK